MKNIVVVGGTNIDDVIILDRDMPIDEKVTPAFASKSFGGGGANSILALNILGRVFGQNNNLTLVTKIGQGKENNFTREVFTHGEDVDLIDAIIDQHAEVPHNTVISHKQGRAIIRLAEFNHASVPLAADAQANIENAIAEADLVLIQTKHPRIAEIAAKAADNSGAAVITDFSNQEASSALLGHTTYGLIPAEFRFSDMPANSTEQDLYDYVSLRLPYAAISDANKDTIRSWNGERETVPSLTVQTKDALGAGDLRDAAFVFFLARDNDPDKALRKANIIASISCEYYGREWEHDLANRLQMFPEFSADLPNNITNPDITYG